MLSLVLLLLLLLLLEELLYYRGASGQTDADHAGTSLGDLFSV